MIDVATGFDNVKKILLDSRNVPWPMTEFKVTASWRSCIKLWSFNTKIFTYDTRNVRHVERI